MDKIYIRQGDIFKMVETANGYRKNQKIGGWYYSGDDEIVFTTNRISHATEHYSLVDFVAQVCENFKDVNDAKCNQFGSEYRGGEDWFFFYRDEGATDCHK